MRVVVKIMVPFLGPYCNTAGTQKGTMILTTTHADQSTNRGISGFPVEFPWGSRAEFRADFCEVFAEVVFAGPLRSVSIYHASFCLVNDVVQEHGACPTTVAPLCIANRSPGLGVAERTPTAPLRLFFGGVVLGTSVSN